MPAVLVDSSVLLDILTTDRNWADWSSDSLRAAVQRGRVVINPIIYAEVSVRFSRIEDLEAVLPHDLYDREPIPFEAAFLAGKAHLAYRRRGGRKEASLADFLIGAHAAVAGHVLLTRDARRCRTYFPGVALIAPP